MSGRLSVEETVEVKVSPRYGTSMTANDSCGQAPSNRCMSQAAITKRWSNAG
jgi:hypothetical protein